MFPPIHIPPGQEADFREGQLVSGTVVLAIIVAILYVLRWCGVELV